MENPITSIIMLYAASVSCGTFIYVYVCMLYIYEKVGTLFQILLILKMSHREAGVFFLLTEKQSSHIFFKQSFNLVSQ